MIKGLIFIWEFFSTSICYGMTIEVGNTLYLKAVATYVFIWLLFVYLYLLLYFMFLPQVLSNHHTMMPQRLAFLKHLNGVYEYLMVYIYMHQDAFHVELTLELYH